MFRRGFKSWCEETALNVRQHQGLASTAPLSPFVLARELRVEVIQPADLKDLPEDVRQVLGSVDASFLAAAFGAVRHEYGDLQNYFTDGLGLGSAERVRLQAHYLEA